LALSLLGCSPSGPTAPDAAAPTCALSAVTAYDPVGKTITGTGTLTCDTMAELSVQVCLFTKATTDSVWSAPLGCRAAGGSKLATLATAAAISLGVGAAKDYRAVADGQVNALSQPTQTSTAVTAP
jgi:hypothetical protein